MPPSTIFKKLRVFIAHNVPAVYDGLTARIEKFAAFLGLANCGCSEPWEWSVANDLASRNPDPPPIDKDFNNGINICR
jgi:hypothetical protein